MYRKSCRAAIAVAVLLTLTMNGRKTMDITLVAHRPCIRLVKQAYALQKLGHTINLIASALDIAYPYNYMLQFDSPKRLQDAVKLLEPYTDLYVVHNEPTWPVAVVRETLPDAKIVLDYHDSLYWYFDSALEEVAPNEQACWYEEDMCVGMCDGFVVPAEPMKHELASRTDRPIATVPPAVPVNNYRYKSYGFMGGLVVQGGHSVPGHYSRIAEHWRDYTKLYKHLFGKCRVFAYAPAFGNEPEGIASKHYAPLVTEIAGVPYDELLNRLGEHTWNLVGNWTEHVVWKYSTPNKFYDALAAGFPSFVLNVQHVIDIIDEEDFGIIGEHPDEILLRWDEQKEKRRLVMLKRHKYALERFIGRAVDLYQEVLRG